MRTVPVAELRLASPTCARWSVTDADGGAWFPDDVHALGPSAPPTRYYSGQERSDHPEHWPPNSVACEEL